MKKFLFIPLMALFTACGESNFAISAVMDGELWESNQYATGRITDDNIVLLNGFNRNFLPVSLAIRDYAFAGTFPLDSLNNSFLFGLNASNGYYSRESKPGLITIESFTPAGVRGGTIVGQFSLTAFNSGGDSLVVRNGKFNVTLTE
jgi:hypothetical protein